MDRASERTGDGGDVATRIGMDEAVNELFALPREEFVSARDALAKRLRAEGDADAARQVKALAKPTTPAWLTNQLVRWHPDLVDAVVELGRRMREAAATHDGSALRELAADRPGALGAAMHAAREVAGRVGVPMSEEAARLITDSLHAAMADPGAAEELRAGRLSRPISHVGFGAPTPDESAAVISLSRARSERRSGAAQPAGTPPSPSAGTSPSTPAPAGSTSAPDRARPDPQSRARRRAGAEAERELAAAEVRAADADETLERLRAELADQRRGLRDDEALVARLAKELADARKRIAEARGQVRRREAAVTRARGEAQRAYRRLRRAQERVHQLDE